MGRTRHRGQRQRLWPWRTASSPQLRSLRSAERLRRRMRPARRLGASSRRSGAREGAAPRSSGWKGAASQSVRCWHGRRRGRRPASEPWWRRRHVECLPGDTPFSIVKATDARGATVTSPNQ
eukprot:scaffold57501_cov50-Phaeocystis_antarctica.AAC.4